MNLSVDLSVDLCREVEIAKVWKGGAVSSSWIHRFGPSPSAWEDDLGVWVLPPRPVPPASPLSKLGPGVRPTSVAWNLLTDTFQTSYANR